ncbi:MAG TPA: tetratricopeptide repeat protein [bacterium]|nr:tetratricopeptide repeat protein [bacterium]HOL47674.1 tetratricopeptide repeat protein [bacterium]HPQ18698.1 tetratricopeptide repeat protein [bacterium]
MKNSYVLIIFLVVYFPIQILSNNIDEDFERALNTFKSNDFKEAIKLFSEIRKKYENSDSYKYSSSLYYLAKAYENAGFVTDAIKIYKDFINLYPNSPFISVAKYQYKKLTEEEIKPEKKKINIEEIKSDTTIKKLPLVDEDIQFISSEDKVPSTSQIDTDFFITKPKLTYKTYIVQKNETLWDIAKKVYGDGAKYHRIVELNNLQNLISISEGDTIIIDEQIQVEEPKKLDEVENIRLIPKEVRIREDDIKESEDYLKIADFQFSKNNYKEAIQNYLKYLEKTSYQEGDYKKALYNVAVSSHFINDIANAIKYYKKYIELYPDGEKLKEANFNLGKIYYEVLKNYGNAKYYFSKVLTFLPEDELNSISANYLKMISKTKAEDLMLKPEEKISEAEIESKTKELEKISEKEFSLREEMELHNKYSEEYNFQPKKNIEEAILKTAEIMQDIKMIPERAPKLEEEKKIPDINSRVLLKPMYSEKKSPKQMQFEEKLYNYDATYFNKKGYEYKLKGMYDEAIKEYQKAIEYFPNNPLAYNNLAYLYAELGTKLNEAENLVYKAINLDLQHKAKYYHTLGWIYFQQGEIIKAKEYIEKSVFYEEDSQIKRYHLGLVYKQLKLFDKAYNQFERAVIIEPNSEIAFKAKLELRLLE